ncbi:hypothetical protein ISO88_09645 [Morganella morganii subsp. morganii]|uniref:hypothetical protein n=1 Tax=Morganella morganii TaxID=582 RepID=UPI001BDA5844|nr:hypothetical protein [Morganella morganii]MBT0330119.1 hypothetical protein [Morganella morganii subsp. morganii]HDS6401457.1 hypothetical protein [Morganella morganii subsp. morganii]
MKVTVKVTDGELFEMGVTKEELRAAVIHDLDAGRDYAGFNVEVHVVDWNDPEVFADS